MAVLFSVSAIVFLACSVVNVIFLILGIIFGVVMLIFWVMTFFTKWYIVLDVDTITLTTLYGKTLKQKKLSDVIKIECREQIVHDRLSVNGKRQYILVHFAKNIPDHDCLNDSEEEPDLILTLYSPQKMKIIEAYAGMQADINDK